MKKNNLDIPTFLRIFSHRKGFSLLEVTIAAVVFAIAILSVVATITINFKLQRSNRETMMAVDAANEKLQEWMAHPLAFKDLNTPGFFYPADFPIHGLQPQEGYDLPGEVQINTFGAVIGLPPAGIKFFEIIVVVRWTGVSGNRKIVLHSQRFRTAADEKLQLTAP